MNDMAAFVQNSSMEDKIEFAMCLLAQMSIRIYAYYRGFR